MTAFDMANLPEAAQRVFLALRDENAKLKRQLEVLSTAAAQDELTGLLNRRGFLKALDNAIGFSARYNLPACLVFIDLNDFKEINDTHGHATGDLVLKTVGQRITSQVRSSDIVARLGGDEFVVLLWQVTEPIARARGTLVMEAICRDNLAISEDLSIEIKASAGVAVLGPDDTADALLARADRAMYQAKSEFKRAG